MLIESSKPVNKNLAHLPTTPVAMNATRQQAPLLALRAIRSRLAEFPRSLLLSLAPSNAKSTPPDFAYGEGRKPVHGLSHRRAKLWRDISPKRKRGSGCASLTLRAGVCAVMSLSLAGCAGFWDDVTSRDFHLKEWFVKPNPLVVLRDSEDGDRRAKALRALREPKQNGGTDQDQEFVVKILTEAAIKERQPLCRLAAIEALGHFQDPRAVAALKDAYFSANNFPKSSPPGTGPAEGFFNSAAVSTELVTRIRCQTLASLGQTGNPAAIQFLVDVLKEPPASKETAEPEKQQLMDLRIAAARALGNFKDYQTIEALVHVVQTEKDVALRDRAHESLEASIGRKLPADPKDWDSILHPEGNPNSPQMAHEPGKLSTGLGSVHSN
jgi:hypothetical protein